MTECKTVIGKWNARGLLVPALHFCIFVIFSREYAGNAGGGAIWKTDEKLVFKRPNLRCLWGAVWPGYRLSS